MARGKKTKADAEQVIHYQHSEDKRINIPTAVIAGQAAVPKAEKKRYYYNPHLGPVLRFDPTGKADRVAALLEKARREPITAEEHQVLAEALRDHQPWLEWTGRREAEEKGWFEVDPVALNIHERISTQAILRSARREDVQRDLFADPREPWQEAVKFYQHDIDWTNRLILGDSLQVMSSLAHRENLAGKVQMIYIDPPYGIRFGSNFQPELTRRNVEENDQGFSREVETVKAYRDTWMLGTHSYLSYLRQRLRICRELLAQSGSLFIQIGADSVHRIRAILDDVFQSCNFCGMINFVKNSGATDALLSSPSDYILWYAKHRNSVKYHQLYHSKTIGSEFAERYEGLLLADGQKRTLAKDEIAGRLLLPTGSKVFTEQPAVSQGFRSTTSVPFSMNGFVCDIGKQRNWKTSIVGMKRLSLAERLDGSRKMIYFLRFLEDFPAYAINTLWTDTQDRLSKKYVVETVPKVIQRCLLMTTDPGDLVLDPTCGSGTTAYVAEQWGRRWITIDTSRVALSIARQRLMTARFENYRTRKPSGGMMENPGTGFIYQTVPHITLKSIAQNTNLDPIFEKHEPVLERCLVTCNAALARVPAEIVKKLACKLLAKQEEEGKKAITDADERRWELKKNWEHWEVPFDTDPDWPAELRAAVSTYRMAWRAKMDEVNACIAANADQEELVDKPETAAGVRVSGPYTVEGVMPAEMDLGSAVEVEADGSVDGRNGEAYLEQMLRLLKVDGVTFKGNKIRKFVQLDSLWKSGQDLPWHAEGWWEGDDVHQKARVAIYIGPQYGPVTARALEEVMPKAGRTYEELVVAGFSFDPEATQIIGDASSHPRLRMHQAFIRPDINPGMDGLLKEQPRSQLFTVFGQPDISLSRNKAGEHRVKLGGVDIYDPIHGDIHSTPGGKVAAWFLDTDYDGRCFCMTQAFFPDQDAWEKIARALKSNAEQYAFDALQGTESIPFRPGEHKRVAVKVIDPRGNEVMVVRRLEE